VSNFKDAEDKHGLILKAWMAVHSINEQGAVVTLSDISTMVRREQLQKLEKELKKSFSVEQYESVVGQLHEISGLFEISEAVNKELVTEKKELQGRNDVLELQKMQLEDDKKAMEEQHKSELAGQGEMYRGMLRKRSEIRDVPRDLPLTVGALKIWAVSFENLIIADKAWEGMRHRNREEQVKTAWDMLWCLNYPVHQFYNGNITAVPSEYIVNNTGYEFSSNESDTTKNRKEWASQRTAVIDRRSIECYKHLKDGVGAGTAMRVYFEYDAETAKIVVAHIGEHLTTKATART